MKVFSVPAEVMCDPQLNITSILERRCADTTNPLLYRWQMSPGNWQPVRAREFRAGGLYIRWKGARRGGDHPGTAASPRISGHGGGGG